MNKAIDVAIYIVNYSIEHKYHIDNLKLQKLLFFIQEEFWNKIKRKCFEDDIVKLEYGAVIPNVYEYFRPYGYEAITKKHSKEYDLKLNKDTLEIYKEYRSVDSKDTDLINNIVDRYALIENPIYLAKLSLNNQRVKKVSINEVIKYK